MFRGFWTFVFTAGLAWPAIAGEMTVSFFEAAPRDQFVVANTADCAFDAVTLTFDLTTADTGLLFDTTPGGAGYNVAQPFQIAAESGASARLSSVEDGDRIATVLIDRMAPRGRIVLTADIDDSQEAGPMGRTMVAGSELAGAEIRAIAPGGAPITAAFDDAGVARLPAPCGFSS